MSDLIENLTALTVACADREARWLNRYNRLQPNGSLELEWGYKEGFYQSRIRELYRLMPSGHLEKIHEILLSKMASLPGEAERNRSPEELAQLIRRFQADDGAANEDVDFPINPRSK